MESIFYSVQHFGQDWSDSEDALMLPKKFQEDFILVVVEGV